MPNVALWKPYSSGSRNRGGLSFIVDGNRDQYKGVSIYDQNDNLLENLSYTPNVPEPGQQGDPMTKFYSSKPGSSFGQNVKARVTYSDGRTEDYNIADGSKQYRGQIGDPSSLKEEAAGAGGGAMGPWQGSSADFGNIPHQFQPGQIGYGAYPAYLGGQFPSPSMSETAPYQFTDPIKFAESFGSFNRDEIRKNFDLSKDLALETIDTELSGMQGFVPAASALKRSETSLDNAFNQQQRTKQIDETLPGARADLEAQAGRSRAFAEGRIPDAVQNQAFELGIRSQAADQAAAGGFGASSSVARKASDLMSAAERVKLSQYGDQLLSSNINQKANLLLAPTEYSNAGSQISVMPSMSASQVTQNMLTQTNANTLVSPGQALSSQIQQNQFTTGLQQNTNQFNTATKNQFKLDKFGYKVGYANAVAGALQTNINTEFGIQQQAMAQQIAQDAINNAQGAGQTGAIATAIGGLLAQIPSIIGALTSSKPNTVTPSGSNGNFDSPADVNANLDTPTPNIDAGTPDFTNTPDLPMPVAGGETPPFDTGYNNDVSNFQNDTGVFFRGANTSAPNSVSAGAVQQANSTLRMSGISSEQIPGTQSIGVDSTGRPQFASSALLRSNNMSAGSDTARAMQATINPMLKLSKEESSRFDTIANAASNASIAATLAAQYQAGDKKGFVNTMLQAVAQPTLTDLVDDPQNKAGVASAFTAYKLFNNWGTMSPAQKSLSIASLGIQGYKFSSGVDLASEAIIKPVFGGANGKELLTPGLTVGQGLNLLAAGYNTYSLVKNWDQLTPLQRIAAGTGDAVQLASLAKNFGLLGSGTTGAEVANVTAASLQAAGWKTASQFGSGAIVGEAGKQLPQGFVTISNQGGQVVAAPAGSAGAAEGAVSNSLLGTAAGVASVAAGAYEVYKGWGKGGKAGAMNGAIGGSAMAAGLYQLGATNPYALAAVVAYTTLGGSIKMTEMQARNSQMLTNPITGQIMAAKLALNRSQSGKSSNQKSRDNVRDRVKELGITDENNQVINPDGSIVNVGIDGHGGKHSVSNADKLIADHKGMKDLNAWDTDYTNDLDYTASMGGISLSRLISGKNEDHVNQIGAQLGNASLGKVGYGKEMTEGNFKQVMANLRSQYAKSGITSKSDAYQLSNQGYAEGRFNESETIAMQQSFNMIFDNDYRTATNLMAGRFKGLEVASEMPSKAEPSRKEPLQVQNSILRLSKAEVRARNQVQYQQQQMVLR